MARKAKVATKDDGISVAKGTYVWWKVNPLEVEKTRLEKDLEKLGFSDLIPELNYRSSMIRAIKFLMKTDDANLRRMYKWFADEDWTAFFITIPELVYDGEGLKNVNYVRDMTLRVHKSSGKVEFGRQTGTKKVKEEDKEGNAILVDGKPKMTMVPTFEWAETTDHPMAPSLLDKYRMAQKFIEADQFRDILIAIVKKGYFGVSMHGGVYYIPAWAAECLDTLKEIFSHFPKDVCILRKTTVRDDADTNEAVEDAVSDDIAARIETLVEKIMKEDDDAKGEMTSKVLGNRRNEARRLMKIINLHQEDLRTKAADLQEKAVKIEQVLGDKQDKKKVDLGSALLAFKGKAKESAVVNA